jgi:hypothetical protein
MVLLNTDILVCKSYIQKSIKNIMLEVMEKYFEDEMLVEKINGKKEIMKNIIKEKMNETKTNHFWYVNSSDNVCTFIHKRGKKNGYMCHKKIKTNLEGQKPDYLCCVHSKKHKPKKRVEKISKHNVIIKESCYKRKKIQKKRIKSKKIIICNSGTLNLADIFKNLL